MTRQHVLAFARDRLTPGQRYGLGLTLALVVVWLAFWGFIEVVELWTRQEDLDRVDRWAAAAAESASPAVVSSFKAVTSLGSVWVAIPLMLAVTVGLLRQRQRRAAGLLIASFAAGQGLLYALKAFFHRARPELQLVAEHGYSFPSGHSFTAALVYGLFAVLAWRSAAPLAARIALAALCVGLAALVGVSRIVLGVHYATDVLGGFTLATAWLAASLAAARVARLPSAARPAGRPPRRCAGDHAGG
ncbi:MAG: phosphatase PAP2 family protein [Planctomycetota bacterium]